MNTHVGRVLEYDQDLSEARVVMGGAACLLCGGRGCAHRDRTVRVAIPPGTVVSPGDTVRVAGNSRANLSAAVRLLLAPGAAAVPGYHLVAGIIPQPLGAGIAVLLVLMIVLWRGSRRSDLPCLVEVIGEPVVSGVPKRARR